MSGLGILWAALLASQVVYVLVALSAEPVAFGLPGALPLGLGVVAAFVAVLADLFYRRATRVGRGAPRRPHEAALVAWALDELIALLGLALALLGFAGSTWAGFSVVGAVLLVLHRPPGGEAPGGPGAAGAEAPRRSW